MKVVIFVVCFLMLVPFAFAKDLFIRVDANNMIIDASSHEANLSESKSHIGRVVKLKLEDLPQHPWYGDHYKDGKVTFDSYKRAEREQEIIDKQNKRDSIRTKLKGLGLTNEEVTELLNN